jgi:hypothetical protein
MIFFSDINVVLKKVSSMSGCECGFMSITSDRGAHPWTTRMQTCTSMLPSHTYLVHLLTCMFLLLQASSLRAVSPLKDE